MIPIILVTDKNYKVEKYIKNRFQDAYVFMMLPETTEYSIKQIRSLTSETAFFQPKIQVYVLQSFDHSSLEAQNAALKLFEEPPTNVQFILSVQNKHKLLGTIQSRCQTIYLKSDDKIDQKIETQNLVIKEIISKKLKYLGNPELIVTKKEEALEKIDQLIMSLREIITTNKLASSILTECLKTRQLIENNNLNPQLSLDHLLIFIVKKYTIK